MGKKWCNHCVRNVDAHRPTDASLCCKECGKVLEDYNFSLEATFFKDAGGQSHLAGNYVRSVQSEFSASRERTLANAKEDMKTLCFRLGMDQPEGIVRFASNLYKIAFERNFTKGRKSEHVQAACVYITCREKNLPYLLIDFSNELNINVYVLGAVFLHLCRVLWLQDHPIVQKPTDPSLFIQKYTTCISGGTNKSVVKTALHIIASMRMDWMQTGRKPSGLWGAAVYVSALAHGLNCSKSDVLKLVHVCEATLTKRLVEFENTKSGSLTIEELNAWAEDRGSAAEPHIELDISNSRELLCEHKETNTPHYKIGLCKSCYNEFVQFSGGLEGGSDPPAFQRAERERAMMSALEREKASSLPEKVVKGSPGVDVLPDTGKAAHSNSMDGGLDGSLEADKNAGDGSDTLSDIDDVEVDGYLHNEEEKQYKKIIWEQMNREYLEEQAAKEAALAAQKEAIAANFKGAPEEVLAAQELVAASQAALAKARKEKQQKRAAEAKNATPAQTAAEAARRILEQKKINKKINYEMLEKLFDETGAAENAKKKQQTESYDDDKDIPHEDGKDDPESQEENDEMYGHADEIADDYNTEDGDIGYDDYGYD